jgi:hypothetical protein
MQCNLGEKNMTEQKGKSRSPALACALIAVVVVASLSAYFSISSLASESSPEGTYHRLFGATPIVGGNYSFNPPVSMYRAIDIALKSDGWNQSSLENMTLYVSLYYEVFYTNVTSLYQLANLENLTLLGHPNPDLNMAGSELLHEVTAPVNDYQPQLFNGASLRYIWTIAVQSNSGMSIPPPCYYQVDAATSELVPTWIIA